MRLVDLILVRHGESEGNLAYERLRNGINDEFVRQVLNRPSDKWRLTKRGRTQAEITGKWLQRDKDLDCAKHFDGYFVSPHYRAMETAKGLNLPNANWQITSAVRERDVGILDSLTPDEREKFLGNYFKQMLADGYYGHPVDGEAFAEIVERVSRFKYWLENDFKGKRAIVVCHNQVMWSFFSLYQDLHPNQLMKLRVSLDPHDHFHNCQVAHYTRKKPGLWLPSKEFGHYRSLCAWDEGLANPNWRQIEKKRFANADLPDLYGDAASLGK